MYCLIITSIIQTQKLCSKDEEMQVMKKNKNLVE